MIPNSDYQSAGWGYISFKDLKELSIVGVEVDREIDWKPKKATEIPKITKIRWLESLLPKRLEALFICS